jgi:hypothetical protein
MYRADLVRARNPFYRLDRPNEDTDVCFELLQECDFAFVHQVLTYLRPRQGSISAKTAQLRAWELADILYVERYAAACMTPAEFGKFRTWAWSRYYRQVAGRVLRSPFQPLPEGFWEFHRDGLTSVGRTLSMARVARGMVEVLARSVISPTRSIRSLSGRPVARPIR